jgi:hypothetical protein
MQPVYFISPGNCNKKIRPRGGAECANNETKLGDAKLAIANYANNETKLGDAELAIANCANNETKLGDAELAIANCAKFEILHP